MTQSDIKISSNFRKSIIPWVYANVCLASSPVVSAGVHSCSPVAPQSSVLDGVVVTDDAKGEFITDVFLFGATGMGS